MALLNILTYPDPRLRQVALPVHQIDERIHQFIQDMAETMYAAPGVGIGLAATQVNVHQRVIVIDVSETRDQLQVLINPEILWQSDQTVVSQEGCLSVPGVYDKVERAAQVKVRALNGDGQTVELESEGLLATCIQHEMDHLLGKVFIEYLSPLKRTRIDTKLKKKTITR